MQRKYSENMLLALVLLPDHIYWVVKLADERIPQELNERLTDRQTNRLKERKTRSIQRTQTPPRL